MAKARTRFDIVAVFEDGAYLRYTSRPDVVLTVPKLVESLRKYADELDRACVAASNENVPSPVPEKNAPNDLNHALAVTVASRVKAGEWVVMGLASGCALPASVLDWLFDEFGVTDPVIAVIATGEGRRASA